MITGVQALLHMYMTWMPQTYWASFESFHDAEYLIKFREQTLDDGLHLATKICNDKQIIGNLIGGWQPGLLIGPAVNAVHYKIVWKKSRPNSILCKFQVDDSQLTRFDVI